MFIGRKKEIESLNKKYISGKFEFIVMYGRKRIGKTRLLSEFCTDKKAIFFVAEEYNETSNLLKFSEIILNTLNHPEYLTSFNNWNSAISFVAEAAKQERIVMVIDEFPYLANASESFLSMLQNMIDHILIDTQLFIVICGSSMSFMEKEVLAYKSPLFGRRTGQMLIKPFNYLDAAKFYKKYTNEEKFKAYGILGGIPQYLLMFSDARSIKENVINEILDNTSYLYDEPINLLHQELRTPAVYNSIIGAIASGETRLNNISTKIHEDGKKVSKYIKTLIDLHIIHKETPVGIKVYRKSLFFLQDNLFSFIYRFVYKYKSLVEQGKGEYVYDTWIEPFFSGYLGYVFEQVCMQFLIESNKKDKLPIVINKIGKWWGNNPIKKQQEEIDVIAIGDDNSAIFGECKYRNSVFTKKMLDGLIEKSGLLPYEKKFYFLFSKSGFDKIVEKEANRREDIFLFNLDDLYNV